MKKINIIILEDNASDTLLMRRALRRADFDFEFTLAEAGNKEEYLRALAAVRPDIVLADYSLPGFDGLSALNLLKERFPEVPLIIVSGAVGEERATEIMKAGATDYMSKKNLERLALATKRALAEAEQLAVAKKTANALFERERFLQKMTDMNPDIIFVTSLADGKETYASKSGLIGLGYDIETIKDERSFSLSIIHPEDLKKMEAAAGEIKEASDDRQRELEIRVRDAGNVWRWFLLRYGVFERDARGAALTVMCVAHEITQRKTVEERLRNFISVLAHELRNPLASIVAEIELAKLQKRIDDPELKEAVEIVERQTSTLARLLDDLLDVSRLERGKIELNMCKTDLSEIIKDAAETTRQLIYDAGQSLKISLPDKKITFYADPIRVEQLILNLLTNASKYSKAGSKIELIAEKSAEKVIIRVRDEGIGIPAESIEQIFNLFSRSNAAKNYSPQGGLGVGLYLSRELARLHGGSIDVNSEGVGKGAEFIVNLPIANRGKTPPPL